MTHSLSLTKLLILLSTIFVSCSSNKYGHFTEVMTWVDGDTIIVFVKQESGYNDKPIGSHNNMLVTTSLKYYALYYKIEENKKLVPFKSHLIFNLTGDCLEPLSEFTLASKINKEYLYNRYYGNRDYNVPEFLKDKEYVNIFKRDETWVIFYENEKTVVGKIFENKLVSQYILEKKILPWGSTIDIEAKTLINTETSDISEIIGFSGDITIWKFEENKLLNLWLDDELTFKFLKNNTTVLP